MVRRLDAAVADPRFALHHETAVPTTSAAYRCRPSLICTCSNPSTTTICSASVSIWATASPSYAFTSTTRYVRL